MSLENDKTENNCDSSSSSSYVISDNVSTVGDTESNEESCDNSNLSPETVRRLAQLEYTRFTTFWRGTVSKQHMDGAGPSGVRMAQTAGTSGLLLLNQIHI